jgi:hypothetical protein
MRVSSVAPSLALLFVTAGLNPAPAQTPTGIVSLATLRDRARPLLIFAPTPNDPQLQIQLRNLQNSVPALAERDIVVIAIPYNSPSPTQATLTDSGAQTARRRFHIDPSDFTVILLGKDGGEKLRSTKPLPIETLLNTIDAMPMRQQEMHSKPHP